MFLGTNEKRFVSSFVNQTVFLSIIILCNVRTLSNIILDSQSRNTNKYVAMVDATVLLNFTLLIESDGAI